MYTCNYRFLLFLVVGMAVCATQEIVGATSSSSSSSPSSSSSRSGFMSAGADTPTFSDVEAVATAFKGSYIPTASYAVVHKTLYGHSCKLITPSDTGFLKLNCIDCVISSPTGDSDKPHVTFYTQQNVPCAIILEPTAPSSSSTPQEDTGLYYHSPYRRKRDAPPLSSNPLEDGSSPYKAKPATANHTFKSRLTPPYHPYQHLLDLTCKPRAAYAEIRQYDTRHYERVEIFNDSHNQIASLRFETDHPIYVNGKFSQRVLEMITSHCSIHPTKGIEIGDLRTYRKSQMSYAQLEEQGALAQPTPTTTAPLTTPTQPTPLVIPVAPAPITGHHTPHNNSLLHNPVVQSAIVVATAYSLFCLAREIKNRLKTSQPKSA